MWGGGGVPNTCIWREREIFGKEQEEKIGKEKAGVSVIVSIFTFPQPPYLPLILSTP